MSMTFAKVFCFLVLVQVLVPNLAEGQGLKVGFYAKPCPNAEEIVNGVMKTVFKEALSLSGPLLRMHFHDCFVRGCDGSILLNSVNKTAEKDSPPNLSLRGFGVIDRVKAALEKQCPGVVSCSDILAIVARDAVVATGGQFYNVETGRRDGSVSLLTDALNNLLPPTSDFATLISGFTALGLNATDLAVLSGGHTIGTSHCSSFSDRLYNFTGKNDTDPSMDKNYIARLKSRCKINDQTTLVEMDPGSVRTFDIKYYSLITKRRGLFTSDQALLNNTVTKSYINAQLKNGGATFGHDFGVSMVKMGRIGVLTGSSGQIRKFCYKNN
ncbi:hypothetical protein MLD38_009992 [Melastoma candidum]|uniref:Uncharacterized protein n=1 Tax=Melastoma candidum TaxID=119954 RepID=A0ACB9R079_9MYRT|nr:hypothetical protein MLD38_009992 [Melastoma candidum]